MSFPSLAIKVHSEDPLHASAGDGASTLALKPKCRVNRSLKRRVQVAPQNGDFVTGKLKNIYVFKI